MSVERNDTIIPQKEESDSLPKQNSTDSIPLPSTNSFLSQGSGGVHGILLGDVLIGGRESTLVSLRLAGVNVAFEAICMNETAKVGNIFMESALCSVNNNGILRMFVHNFN